MVLHLVQDNVGPHRPLPQVVADVEAGGAAGGPRPADNSAMPLSQSVSQSDQTTKRNQLLQKLSFVQIYVRIMGKFYQNLWPKNLHFYHASVHQAKIPALTTISKSLQLCQILMFP